MTIYTGITAHRGNHAYYPENTLPAFKAGLELGVDWLELDVRRTVDGVLVVHHDPDTARTTGEQLVIAETAFERLRELDFSTVHRQRDGRLIGLSPCRMPKLEEVLHLARSYPGTRVSIQPKTGDVTETVQLVRNCDMADRVGFNDIFVETLRDARQQMPDVPIFMDLRPGQWDLTPAINTALMYDFHCIVFYWEDATPTAIDTVHRAGLQTGVWTLNDLAVARRLKSWGISRFYTDLPARFLALAGRETEPPRNKRC